MSKKYVLMCDYGLDDAAATAFVLDNRKAGDSVDVMPIGGNSEKSVAYRNGQTLLARYEGSLDGVRVVDTREEEQPFANLPSIHGEDGMGDLFAPETSSVPVVKFAEWMKETDEIVLVSLGPCTLTEKIVAAREVSLLLVRGRRTKLPRLRVQSLSRHSGVQRVYAFSSYGGCDARYVPRKKIQSYGQGDRRRRTYRDFFKAQPRSCRRASPRQLLRVRL